MILKLRFQSYANEKEDNVVDWTVELMSSVCMAMSKERRLICLKEKEANLLKGKVGDSNNIFL